MASNSTLNLFKISESYRAIPGYQHGIRHPSISFKITLQLNQGFKVPKKCEYLFKEILGNIEIDHHYCSAINNSIDLVDIVLKCLSILYEKTKYPIFDQHKMFISKKDANEATLSIFAPSYTPDLSFRLLTEFFNILNGLINRINIQNLSDVEKSTIIDARKISKNKIAGLVKILTSQAPQGFNTYEILKSAYKMKIPYKQVFARTFILGEGADQVWFDSTCTTDTGFISSMVAKNKIATKNYLNLLNYPTANFKVCSSLPQVKSFIEDNGYPVVLKPTQGDGGIGVFAHLTSAPEVENYFHKIKKISKTFMVEKHIYGSDIRVTIYQNKIIDAFERRPGGVIGDGLHSIAELVDIANNSKEAKERNARFNKINLTIDEEALEVMEKIGMHPECIPEPMQFIKLRRQGNVSTGGIPIAIELNEIHPDNKQLFIELSKNLNLIFLGIDILIPDIGRSWKIQECSICELNNQPQLRLINNQPMIDEIIKDTFKKNIFRVSYVFSENDDYLKNALSKRIKNFNDNFFVHKKVLYSPYEELMSYPESKSDFMIMQSQGLNKDISSLVVFCNIGNILQLGLPYAYNIKSIFLFEDEVFKSEENMIRYMGILNCFIEQDLISVILKSQTNSKKIKLNKFKDIIASKLKVAINNNHA